MLVVHPLTALDAMVTAYHATLSTAPETAGGRL
jgi:hypothetical protein